MSIAIIVTDRDVSFLQQKIKGHLPKGIEVWAYPDIPDYTKIEMAVLWKHPAGILKKLPQLKLVSSLGAGVEHILSDADLPDVPITRIVDDNLTQSMRNYVLMVVLNIQKQFQFYQKNQQRGQWKKPEQIEIPLKIGVLGLGALGGAIAQTLANLGFDVLGYSQSPKKIKGVLCFNATDFSLPEFVSRTNVLICLLPRTSATEGILNYPLFQQFPKSSFLINVARGAHLVETDLLRAVEDGHIATAYLDVFQQEPLPPNHPFWSNPKIVVTPHIASITNQENAAEIIADNYQRLQSGSALLYVVNKEKGY